MTHSVFAVFYISEQFYRFWKWRVNVISSELEVRQTHDVIEHLTIRLPIGHFLLAVSISNGFRGILPQNTCAHRHNAESSLRMRDIT